MQIENILALASVLVCITSVCLFLRLFPLNPEQPALIEKSKPGAVINFITFVPLFFLLILGSRSAKVIASVAALPVLLLLTWYHFRWLLANGADRAFIRRLILPSTLSTLGLVLFVVAVLLGFSVFQLF